jgi:5-methylthioadenosine/S-adenosylhomocysteine deaminase
MEQCDTLIDSRWCLPVEPSGELLVDHAIAVRDGRIVAILPSAEAHERFDAGATVARREHVLIPGLINAHTHAAMTLFRGLADDLPLSGWLRQGIWPAEKRWVSAEMVRDGTRHAIAEMLKSGTTCFSDQYFFPETVAEAASDLHMRAVVATPVFEFETAWARDGADCLRKAADLVHDAYADHQLITTAFAPHSTDAVSDQTFRALRVLADQLDRRIQIHLHETRSEIDTAVEKTGERPFERLERLGLVNSSLMTVHAVYLTDEEMRRMVAAGVCAVHCPRSNLKLASGIARVPAMQAAGITVAIGTDGAASNNVLDMLDELRTASLLAKAGSGDAAAVDAHTALRMATLDGARSLGIEESTGSLVAGKWADIACVDLRRLRSQPVYDPASQLVYTCGSEQVTDVWVAGRHLLEGGELTNSDEDEIIERSREWQRRIGH